MTPGADPHANVAAGSHLAPVVKTGLRIQLPAECAVDLRGIIHGNGIGRAAGSALFTDTAEILHPDIHRFIRCQGKVGGHRPQPDSGAELFGHNITESSHLSQTRRFAGRPQLQLPSL